MFEWCSLFYMMFYDVMRIILLEKPRGFPGPNKTDKAVTVEPHGSPASSLIIRTTLLPGLTSLLLGAAGVRTDVMWKKVS